MEHLSRFIGKVRPQIFLALSILGVFGYVAIRAGHNEIAVGCLTGIVALAKDVLQSDTDK
jgi:hypothetical protein